MLAKKHSSPIEKKLQIRLFITLILYVVGGYAGMMLFQYIFSLFKNPLTEWVYWRIDVLYFFYLCIGMTCIFYHYWRKPWTYLDEVLAATQTIYEQNDRTIELSETLREVEQQMNQIKMSILMSQQAAKDAENKKNELVMYLAHDIRTPLTTVIGYLSLLDEASDMPVVQKEKYIGIALEKAERLEMLINELFEITRYHTNTVRLKHKSVDLYALLSQVVEEFYPAISARGNSARISAEDDLDVIGDPEKLARVFSNLLKNAVAYSYPNTEISINVKANGKYAAIVFKNHGQTIPAEQLTTIFEKFSRLDEARLSDTGGAGLGLSIAKEIIHLHGGDITAQSINDTITFTITLPFSS